MSIGPWEEAIEELYRIVENQYRSAEKDKEALSMAIEALSAEPCEDCISRAEAKRIVDYYIKFYDGQFRINESIDKLPSVQPKAKTDVLDKIRAEFISLYPKNFAGEPELGGSSCVFSLNKILCIIDKYKVESEDEK